jgi:hypothetical protein
MTGFAVQHDGVKVVNYVTNYVTNSMEQRPS